MSASALAGMLNLYFITNKVMGKRMGVGVGRGGGVGVGRGCCFTLKSTNSQNLPTQVQHMIKVDE